MYTKEKTISDVFRFFSLHFFPILIFFCFPYDNIFIQNESKEKKKNKDIKRAFSFLFLLLLLTSYNNLLNIKIMFLFITLT